MRIVLLIAVLSIHAQTAFTATNDIGFYWIEDTLNGKIAFVMGALTQIEDFCNFKAVIDSREGKDHKSSFRDCFNANFPSHVTVMDFVNEIDRIYTQPGMSQLPQKDAYRQALNTLMARKPKE